MAEAAVLVRPEGETADLDKIWALDAATDNLDSVDFQADVVAAEMSSKRTPDVIRVQDLDEEETVQSQHARGLGSLAIGQVVERPKETLEDRIVSLVSMLEHAKRGDAEALEENIRLALIEALLAEGYAGEIEIERDTEGFLHQNGQRLYDVLANTLQFHPGNHPELHKVAQAEALGYDVFDMLDKAGYFDQGYVWVIPCMAPTDTPGSAIREYGYFENIAMTWRTIHKDPVSGTFKMRSMFVAGATPYDYEEPDDRVMKPEELDQMYENRLDRRHDIRVATGVYEKEGLEAPTTIPDFLRGFLKKVDTFNRPDHPEADLAEMSDDILGPNHWLGRPGERKDYVRDGELRATALKSLVLKRSEIAQEVAVAMEGVTDDMAIGHCIAKIVKRHVVDFMIDNPDEREIIGTHVLGRAAEKLMLQHDALKLMGDFVGAGNMRNGIHATARANMCGHGSGGEKSDGKSDDADGSGANGGERSGNGGDRRAKCEITVDTCYCSLLHSDGTPRRTPLSVKAEYDSEGTLHCFRCEAYVSEPDDNGNVKSFEGYIAARARRRKHVAVTAVDSQVEDPKKQRISYALVA